MVVLQVASCLSKKLAGKKSKLLVRGLSQLNKIFQYFSSFFFLENMPQICGISKTRNV